MVTEDIGYRKKATTQAACPQMTTQILSTDLFLPEHLRLGSTNWLEFKLAIETVLQVKGIPLAHLKSSECPRAPYLGGEKTWAEDDQLCKAIVLLNVRPDHVRFATLAHEPWSAAEVWETLVQRDLDLRKEVLDKESGLIALFVMLIIVIFVVLPVNTLMYHYPFL
ncbi:hypothetical protein BD413DRAFT_655235 [Trametes elegans]|nr:hypothetical protein BD413DRAFT_655235 [Trametes elegans]